MVHRSSRLPTSFAPNRLTLARAAAGAVPFDLTETNPTRCRLPYPAELLAPLADPAGLAYRPEPRGPLAARSAVAATFARWSCAVDPERVVLTTSTSEAYACLVKLLADPGDAILVPTPSYPLFASLLALEGVVALPYPLDPDDDWQPELAAVAAAPERVRAVVVVHPNNPTGSLVAADRAAALASLCRERGWALIADEVFLPFVHAEATPTASFAATAECLSFTLGGLSKRLGLPQLKLAWTVVSGPDEDVRDALDGLDWVTDTYLSVSTPVALATPTLLADAAGLEAAIAARCRSSLAAVAAFAAAHPSLTFAPPAGGWSAVLRLPGTLDEEEVALEALAHGVAVQPGFLFDLPFPSALVVSLLPPTELVAQGLARLAAVIARLY